MGDFNAGTTQTFQPVETDGIDQIRPALAGRLDPNTNAGFWLPLDEWREPTFAHSDHPAVYTHAAACITR